MSVDLPKAIDKATDVLEGLTSTQTSRAGHSAARVASALANGVAPEVLALQATLNSKKNNPSSPLNISAEDILSVGKWFAANKTRPALTKEQVGSIVRQQIASDQDLPDAEPAF